MLIIFLTWFPFRLKRLSMVCIFLTKNYMYFGINRKGSFTLQKWPVKAFWIYNISNSWIKISWFWISLYLESPKRITFVKGTIRELRYISIYTFETVIEGYTNCIEMVGGSVGKNELLIPLLSCRYTKDLDSFQNYDWIYAHWGDWVQALV